MGISDPGGWTEDGRSTRFACFNGTLSVRRPESGPIWGSWKLFGDSYGSPRRKVESWKVHVVTVAISYGSPLTCFLKLSVHLHLHISSKTLIFGNLEGLEGCCRSLPRHLSLWSMHIVWDPGPTDAELSKWKPVVRPDSWSCAIGEITNATVPCIWSFASCDDTKAGGISCHHEKYFGISSTDSMLHQVLPNPQEAGRIF